MSTHSKSGWSSGLEVCSSWFQRSTQYSQSQIELSPKSRVLLTSRTITSVPCRISLHTTHRDDIVSTRSSRAFVLLPVSPPDRRFLDHTKHNQIILLLRNLPAAHDTRQSFPGSYSSRSSWVYQEAVLRVSKELGSHLCMKIDMKIKRGVLHQL